MLKYKIPKLVTSRKLGRICNPADDKTLNNSIFILFRIANPKQLMVFRKPFMNGFYVGYFVITWCHLL